jgi:SAM-dependent methyltransferase
VGCGSGRDLLWFKHHGFDSTGLERSPGLAQLARDHSGCHVIFADFETFDFSTLQVDAVILAGSLVHVPHEKLADVLARIMQSLRPDGVVLVTLKEGKGVKTSSDGRVFYLWDDLYLQALFANNGFTLIDFSRQVSKIRKEDVWLGYVL